MTAFIEVLNSSLQKERANRNISCKSFFVEHKVINPNPTFKAIKEYNVFIYIVNQDKNPIVLFKSNKTFNSSKETPEEVYNDIIKDIMMQFIKLIKDYEWEKIVNGHFESKIDGTPS